MIKLYNQFEKEMSELKRQLKEVIKSYPNDADLGDYIRNRFKL